MMLITVQLMCGAHSGKYSFISSFYSKYILETACSYDSFMYLDHPLSSPSHFPSYMHLGTNGNTVSVTTTLFGISKCMDTYKFTA